MAVLVLGLALFLAMAAHSDAAYCVCNAGATDALQRNIDYACGNGADCSAINQNGACYNPNTVRDHCNYAVNSYYQRRGQTPGSCDFSSTAVVSQNPPSGTSSGCVYQSSPSGGGTTGTPPTMGGTTPTTPGGSTGSTTPPTGGGTTTPTTPGGSTGSTTPPTGGGTTTTTPSPPGSSTTNPTPPGSGSTNSGGMTPGVGSSTNPGGMTPGTMVPPGGTAGGINTLGPSGSGLGPDYSASVSLSLSNTAFVLVFYSVTLLLSGLVWGLRERA